MALIPGKCTACGAKISVDSQGGKVICEYCGTAFINDEKPKTEPGVRTAAQVHNHYYTAPPPPRPAPPPPPVYIPPRPRIKWGRAILGLFFYVFPGVLYIGYVTYKQHQWDEKYAQYFQRRRK